MNPLPPMTVQVETRVSTVYIGAHATEHATDEAATPSFMDVSHSDHEDGLDATEARS